MDRPQHAANEVRYDYKSLHTFARELATKAGLPADRAGVVAEILLEGDLMGHTTHGLAMLTDTLKSLEAGTVRKTGEPEVISDKGSAVVWDGESLPGPWLMSKAIDEACERARTTSVVTYVIRRAAHINCLGAYLRKATDKGMMIWIMNSAPNSSNVAAAGSIDPLLAPDPLAFGYPTNGEPILIDISTSPVANGWLRRWHAEGKTLPEAYLQDAEGNLSDNPGVLFGKPPGTMLPLGGTALGHKGFALGLIVEILTCGLTGTGRANPTAGGTPVFLQIINPEFFSGTDAVKTEATWVAGAARKLRPRPGQPAVRMPGDTANASRARQRRDGIALHPTIMPELAKWAQKLDVELPQPLA